MVQTWKIKGQVYTHAQLLELKRQGLDPRKDEIVMKFITNPKSQEKEAIKEPKEPLQDVLMTTTPSDVEVIVDSQGLPESDEEEFARLKSERAWLDKDKNARYNELKAKLK